MSCLLILSETGSNKEVFFKYIQELKMLVLERKSGQSIIIQNGTDVIEIKN